MRILTVDAGGNGAPLTGYIQEPSPELGNAQLRPGVLVLPGGGYAFTSDREAEPVALAYLAEGFNAFVLRYRTGPDVTAEDALADAEAALAWIRANASELHVDPHRMVAVGFSAGGHLACSLGVAVAEPPDALVVGYPVTQAEFGAPMGKAIIDIPSRVTSRTPPTFLFSTCDDTVVPISNSLALLTALAKAGVPFESHIYLLGPHGLSLSRRHTADGQAAKAEPSVAAWFADSVRFLRSVLGDFELAGDPETIATIRARGRVGLDMPLQWLMVDATLAETVRAVVPGLPREPGWWLFSSLRELSLQDPVMVPPDRLPEVERAITEPTG